MSLNPLPFRGSSHWRRDPKADPGALPERFPPPCPPADKAGAGCGLRAG